MTRHQPSSGDFQREDQPAMKDVVVVLLTTYSRMIVTPEEVERQLLAAYGPDRMPGSAARARSQEGRSRPKRDRTPAPHGSCEQCGEPRTWGLRFCSWSCYRQWAEEHRPPPLTVEEILAEAYAALDELREMIE